MKKVSVIITTFKRCDNLKRAIDSVLNQVYPNIEIIVVDDNNEGTDYRHEVEKIMEKYVYNKNIKYVKHKMNLNGAAARNTGIKIADGEYIAFLDDDDIFCKERVDIIVSELEKNNEYDGAFTNVAIYKKNKLDKYLKIRRNEDEYLDLTLGLESIVGTGSNLFFRKRAIEQIGMFDTNFYRHQDMEYLVRFFLKGFRLLPIDELTVVKFNDNCINVPSTEKSLKIKKMYIEKFKESILTSNRKKWILTNIFRQCVVCAVNENNQDCLKKIINYAKTYNINIFNIWKIYFKQRIKQKINYKRKRINKLTSDEKIRLLNLNIE